MTMMPLSATLSLDLNDAFMALVLDFGKGCARAFGLTEGDAARVRLACEEVFGYLCHAGKGGSEVTLEAKNTVYEMEIRFAFKGRFFDPYAFNLTATVRPEEGHTDNLGLLIASRSVDRFSIRHDGTSGVTLVLTKEKTYPPWQADESKKALPLKEPVIRKPDSEAVKRFVRSGAAYYDALSFPPFFRSPARMLDMISQGDYHALVTTGTGTQGGEVGGGIIWRPVGKAMVEFYGPYVFNQPQHPDLAQALVDGFLGAIAKTNASGTFGRYTTADLPHGYFEPLGAISYCLDTGARQSSRFHYRQLKEDEGSHVWAHPQLKPFLIKAYHRLFLPRGIMDASFDGETQNPHSVLSVEFDRLRGSVTIRPVWDGADGTQNIAGHVGILKGEAVENIFFELDLGSPWQAKLAPALFKNGFMPELVLPYAGQADVVIFQHTG